MDKKFEMNWAKIEGGCQSGRKVVTHYSKSDLPLVSLGNFALSRVEDSFGSNLDGTYCKIRSRSSFFKASLLQN